ncbi:SMC-Scp complex subunit ScpB [Natronoglycomyces albus]|uniref:SMC-Scp complex subunit ScpB n=1 Tax=Natronoglycomyces albus TaxID=2811108 RepID=A0A895XDG7_9ACTN|nr:SMC-Scp complex subunit ScpB [Natronoglycomyces albus]QSB03851.1 SMC-Scp complex subunit ScpB [Natronoglycomyces albus]
MSEDHYGTDTEPHLDDESTDDHASTEAQLAEQVAEWKPPWQRGDTAPPPRRPDTPEDEPAAAIDEYAQALAANDVETAHSQHSKDTAPDASTSEPAEALDTVPVADEVELGGVLEAILMICDEPLSEDVLASVLERPLQEVSETLGRLAAEYTGDGRGFELRRQAGGWRFYTRSDYAKYVERFVTDGQSSRLTKAALETLAVVAYRQPVTRGRISAIRGVNCDGVIRTLMSRGLIEECGTDPDSTAMLYCTTTLFLEKLGLNSVAELPELAPYLPDDVTEVESD